MVFKMLRTEQPSATVVARPASYGVGRNPSIGTTVNRSPCVEIVEQPKQRGLRFRYKCEGRSAGSILGENSTTDRKTYPTIKINNFDRTAAIIVVSCVTRDPPHAPHPHNLVGTDCKDGVCTVKVKGFDTVSFTNMGIQCCKKQEVEQSLKLREKIRVNPFGTAANKDVAGIDLSTVRLCFQAFLADANGRFTKILTPVVSEPIIDKKSVRDLAICRLSRQSGYAHGRDEVFLLCEKINKDDIKVRFFEETEDGVSWEDYGDFSPQDVHHQYAIVFQTPPYKNRDITSSVQVWIQLWRPSDDGYSDPKPFQYIPIDPDPYLIETKRKRLSAYPLEHGAVLPLIPLTVDDVYEDSVASNEVFSSDWKVNLKQKVERRMSQKKSVEPIQLYPYESISEETPIYYQSVTVLPDNKVYYPDAGQLTTLLPSAEQNSGNNTSTDQQQQMSLLQTSALVLSGDSFDGSTWPLDTGSDVGLNRSE